MEDNATLVTLKSFLFRVNSLMLNEVILSNKSFPTLTLIGLLASMNSLMHNEGRTLAKGLSTVTTFIWFLSRVCSLM